MTLQIAPEAKKHLLDLIAESSLAMPVISLECHIASFSPHSGVTKAVVDGADPAALADLISAQFAAGNATPKRQLAAGFHSEANVPLEHLVTIDGLKFYIAPVVLEQLSSYSLDVVEQQLCLRDASGTIVQL